MALNELAQQSFAVTRQAYDARADRHQRTVHMSLTHVSIERVIDRVHMRVAVPVASYRAVTILVHAPSASATVTLRHEDSDLDVVLAVGDASEATIVAKAWASVLEKPIELQAGVTMLPAQPRGGEAAKPARRSAFARRRKPGRPALMMTRFTGEREIIART